MQLDNQLYQLLYRNNCVVLPGFGGFIGHAKSAEIISSQGIIQQPRKSFSFNKNLITNDGLVYHFIAQKLDITYNKAEEICKEFIQNMIAKLYHGESIVFHNIGKLYLDIEKNIQFFPNLDENFALGSFGLKNITVHPIKYAAKSEEVLVQIPVKKVENEPVQLTFVQEEKLYKKEKTTNAPLYTTQVPSQFKKLKLAAILIVALGITSLFLAIINHNSEQGIGQQSSIFATMKTIFESKGNKTPDSKTVPIVDSKEQNQITSNTSENNTPTYYTPKIATNNVISHSTIHAEYQIMIDKYKTLEKLRSAKQFVSKKNDQFNPITIIEKQVGKEEKKTIKPDITKIISTPSKESVKIENKAVSKTINAPNALSADASAEANLVFGSFKSNKNAEKLIVKLKAEGINATVITTENNFSRVVYKTNNATADKLKVKHAGCWTIESIGK